jgi:RHS repeat-associated protein
VASLATVPVAGLLSQATLDQVSVATDGDGDVEERYLHGVQVDQVLAGDVNGTTQWYLSDQQGSVRTVISSSGSVVKQVEYDGFGNIVSDSAPSVELRYAYTGRDTDADTGLQFNRARWFDATAGRWISEDPMGFDLLPGPEPDRQEVLNLPVSSKNSSLIREAEIELTSPLFLKSSEGDRKQPILRPTFSDLMRAGLRSLGPLHKLYGEALPDAVFAKVKEAALSVPTIRAEFREFSQRKWSHRTKDRFELRGVVGRMTVGPVPEWLLPWLAWARRVHVGTHRIAGAGGWRIASS